MTKWKDAVLGDEIELAYGKSLPAHTRHQGPFEVFGSNGRVGHHKEALISGPGIIVGRKGSVGEIVYSRGDFWPIDTTYYILNKGEHDWRFLFHCLSNLGLTELNSHSAVPGLNREDVYSIGIKIPPRHEQEKIAGALDAIQRCLHLERELVDQTHTVKRAAMKRLFTRGLRKENQRDSEKGLVPERWVVEPLDKHFFVASGGTPSRNDASYWTRGSIPWVKTAEVNYTVIRQTEELITQAGLDNSAAKLLPVDTLLLAMYGQGVTRGRVSILGIEAACNQACAAIRPSDDAVEIKFLYHLLSADYEAIRQLAHGGQQQNLNLDIVRDLPVQFPLDKDEQLEIIAILDAIDRKADLHRRKRLVLEQLFRSVLYKLMIGEISTSDLDLSALASGQAEHGA